MFDILAGKKFFSVLNKFVPILFKIPYSESSLARTQPKLKVLAKEDFTRSDVKDFKKNFIENLFLNKFQEDVLAYPQLNSLEDFNTLKKHLNFAHKMVTATVDDKNALCEVDTKKAVSVLKKYEFSGFKLPVFKNGFGYLSSEYTFMHEVLGLDPALSKTICEHEDLGIYIIDLFGSDIQKEQYLVKLISGENIACFAHLEPGNLGSLEEGSLLTSASLSEDKQSYQISGTKNWVYNADCADVFILSTNVKSSSGENVSKPTLFLVDKNSPGIEIHCPKKTIGLKNINICDVTFNNVVVPSTCVLGSVGKANDLIKEVLSKGKLNNGGHCLALMKKLVNKAINHCIFREFFKMDKCEMNLFKIKIGKMVSRIYAVESMTYLMTGRFDSHFEADVLLESLIVKIFASDNLHFIVQQALEILGPEFFTNDENLTELSKDSLFHVACDDSNDYLRLKLSTAGLKHAINHKQTTSVWQNITEAFSTQNIRNIFFPSPKYFAFTNILKGYLHSMFADESRILEDSVYNLNRCTKHLINTYGENVFEREAELKYLANMVISIYAMAATLARASRAYCMGVKFKEVDRICAEVEVRASYIVVQRARLFILKANKSTTFSKTNSNNINHTKYSQFYPAARNLIVRNN